MKKNNFDNNRQGMTAIDMKTTKKNVIKDDLPISSDLPKKKVIPNNIKQCYTVDKGKVLYQTKLGSLREAAGFTQLQLAQKSGISIRTIQAYEIGSRNFDNCSVKRALLIADLLQCNVRDLLNVD